MSAPDGTAAVRARGARRIRAGHPWVFADDVSAAEGPHGGAVRIAGPRGEFLGWGHLSHRSKIALRIVRRDDAPPDAAFWRERAFAALDRRAGYARPDEAERLVFSESDGIPGIIADRYADHLVVQALTAGAERVLPSVIDPLAERLAVRSVLLRHDATSRAIEGLPREIRQFRGTTPERIEVREGEIVYVADPWHGQKTGAFLDQRENRLRCASIAKGAVLDVFGYHGSFALHAARRAERVVVVDSSAEALARAGESAGRNGLDGIELHEANAFDDLRARVDRGERWDVVVLDPPAFAKRGADAPRAARGYKEVNLRAMKLLAPGGTLVTSSCSYHMGEEAFLALLADAAADAGRVFRLLERRGQAPDHPERLGFPESRYLKCFVLALEEGAR